MPIEKTAIPVCDNVLNVLFVEDNTYTRETMLFLLKLYFKNIDIALDGKEGLEQYHRFYKQHQRYYDIVITDIYMPNMNGIDMIIEILRFNSRQEFIVVSADNETDDLISLINLGVSNFLLKPISPPKFKQIIERVIQTVQDQKKLFEQHEEIKQMNIELQQAKEHAENVSRLKSDFLANMSHEIRTPLNAINGFISLLKTEEQDPTKKRYLDIIEESSNTLLQIISDILDISKIENGKLELEPLNFNPYHDLIMVTELFQARAAEKNITLKVQYNHSMPECLNGDLLRIKQIISNLLSNAIKFTPENGKIKCIIWYKKSTLYVKVKDYGIGIAKEKQEHIFDAFAQEDSSTVREYGGTGLGLSISYRLSKLLKGDLTLKSIKGKGSSFLFSATLPNCPDGVSKKSTDSKSFQVSSGKHILLVEDNRANQLFMGIILKKMNLEYTLAADGVEAVEKAKTQHFDLILMDENMPKLNGIGATKAIREYEKANGQTPVPIISLTANALKGDKERFISAGMNDYLAKPIDQQKVADMLAKHLDSSSV